MLKAILTSVFLATLIGVQKPPSTADTSAMVNRLSKKWLLVGEYDSYRQNNGLIGYSEIKEKTYILNLRSDHTYYEGDIKYLSDSIRGTWEYDTLQNELVFFSDRDGFNRETKKYMLLSEKIIAINDSSLQLARDGKCGGFTYYYSSLK